MLQPVKIYGIKNCDTVKKALSYLTLHKIIYEFIDLKTSLTPELLTQFLKQAELKDLINRQSTTWRKLDELTKTQLNQPNMECLALLVAHPTLLKRPIVCYRTKILIGFSEVRYAAFFALSC